MTAKKRKFLDYQIVGVILGLIAPMLGIYLFYWFSPITVSFKEFVHMSFTGKLVEKVLSIGLMANLLIFLGFFGLKMDRVCRGIILSTLIYGFFILIFKFFV